MTDSIETIPYNAPTQAIVWGIVNITPDSFSDGGLFYNPENAIAHALKLREAGADILDIGAASSRPHAEFISAKEEWERLEPVLNFLCKNNETKEISLSVDTWQSCIAQKSLELGVMYINDISAFAWDNALLDILVQYKPQYVLMHCQGKPNTMQKEPYYENVVDSLIAFFEKKLHTLTTAGLPEKNIILDMGIGFGKTLEHNLALLNAAPRFLEFGLPLMAAVSRKSLFRQIFSIDKDNIQELDSLTAQASFILAQKGFIHHRVHNVRQVKQAFTLQNLLAHS